MANEKKQTIKISKGREKKAYTSKTSIKLPSSSTKVPSQNLPKEETITQTKSTIGEITGKKERKH